MLAGGGDQSCIEAEDNVKEVWKVSYKFGI